MTVIFDQAVFIAILTWTKYLVQYTVCQSRAMKRHHSNSQLNSCTVIPSYCLLLEMYLKSLSWPSFTFSADQFVALQILTSDLHPTIS